MTCSFVCTLRKCPQIVFMLGIQVLKRFLKGPYFQFVVTILSMNQLACSKF